MRQIRYAVAMSLDAYIAGPKGEYDWIIMDPEIDFGAIWSRYDTLVMGRRTFELIKRGGGGDEMQGMKVIVVSRTLRQEDYPDVTIIADKLEEKLSRLRSEPGKDIWLFGGANLFRCLLDLRLVDTVEITVSPILLSQGIPLLPPGSRSPALRLIDLQSFPSSITSVRYAVTDD